MRQSKREEVIDTALKVFSQEGFQVKLERVMALGGFAKMTVYNHFPSKDDLVAAVLDKRNQQVQHAIMSLNGSSVKPKDILLGIFDVLMADSQANGFNGCLFLAALDAYPDPKNSCHASASNHKRWLRDWLLELATKARLKSPAMIADQWCVLINGALVTAESQQSIKPLKAAKTMAEKVLHAY